MKISKYTVFLFVLHSLATVFLGTYPSKSIHGINSINDECLTIHAVSEEAAHDGKDTVYTIVDEMPAWPGCKSEDRQATIECTNTSEADSVPSEEIIFRTKLNNGQKATLCIAAANDGEARGFAPKTFNRITISSKTKFVLQMWITGMELYYKENPDKGDFESKELELIRNGYVFDELDKKVLRAFWSQKLPEVNCDKDKLGADILATKHGGPLSQIFARGTTKFSVRWLAGAAEGDEENDYRAERVGFDFQSVKLPWHDPTPGAAADKVVYCTLKEFVQGTYAANECWNLQTLAQDRICQRARRYNGIFSLNADLDSINENNAHRFLVFDK